MAGPSFFKAPRETAAERQSRRRRPIGYRDPVKRTNASNCPDLDLPKGRPWSDIKAERHALEVAVIKATREAVFARSAFCEICGDTERETAQKSHKASHEMHEDPSRAQTRGRPAEERFNVRICLRTCEPCHKVYGYRVRCLPLTAQGFAGPYDVQFKNGDGEWVTSFTVDRQRGLHA